MVLVAGTSLSGMNADRLAHSAAESALKSLVIVNLQRTKLDDKATVRVWAKTDDFFPLVAEALGVGVEKMRTDVTGSFR
jgi:NAD-dependent SIR2 family protein deacetylase